jgi:hypothetical protein
MRSRGISHVYCVTTAMIYISTSKGIISKEKPRSWDNEQGYLVCITRICYYPLGLVSHSLGVMQPLTET